MPSRGIMRSKRLRAGTLGQSARLYNLGGKKVAGAQGLPKVNPSMGSLYSLGVVKQNKQSGGK